MNRSHDWEALSANERREKARAIQEDIEALHDPPESLKDDVAALLKKDDYEEAVEYLNTPWYNR